MRQHSCRLVLLLLLLPLTLVGCDVGNELIRCDYAAESRCQERTGLQTISFFDMCEDAGGEVMDDRCIDEGKVGGCDLSVVGAAGDVFDWYYEPLTREEAEGNCGPSEPFLEP